MNTEQQERTFLPLQHVIESAIVRGRNSDIVKRRRDLGYPLRNREGDHFEKGEVLSILNGDFQGFVGKVISSTEANLTGQRIVLRREPKAGARCAPKYSGAGKEHLKEHLKEVLGSWQSDRMTSHALMESISLGPMSQALMAALEEWQPGEEAVKQIAIEVLEEHYGTLNVKPAAERRSAAQGKSAATTTLSSKLSSRCEEKEHLHYNDFYDKHYNNFPSFYDDEIISVAPKHAFFLGSVDYPSEGLSLSGQPDNEYKAKCFAELEHINSVAKGMTDPTAPGKADPSAACCCAYDYYEFEVEDHQRFFDTMVSVPSDAPKKHYE